jgi:hypothetical protein
MAREKVGINQVKDLDDTLYDLQGNIVDLGNNLNDGLSGKQDTLTSGTNIKTINGASILGSGDIVVATASPVEDQIVNGVTTKAPSQNAVFDALATVQSSINSKQNTLVSGTDIKTINGTSLLGSGDLVISGGGGSGYTDEQVIQAVNYSLSPSSGGPVIGTVANVGSTELFTVNANVLTLTDNLPLGIQDSDAVLAFVFMRAPIVLQAGWSILASESMIVTSTTTTQYHYLLKKNDVTTSDSGQPITFTQTTSNRMGFNFLVLRSSSGIVELREFKTISQASGSSAKIPVLTATGDECFVMSTASGTLVTNKPTTMPLGVTLTSGDHNITYYQMFTAYQYRAIGESNDGVNGFVYGASDSKTAIVARFGAGGVPSGRTLTPLDVYSKNEINTKLIINRGLYQTSIPDGTGFLKKGSGIWSYDNSSYALSTHTHSTYVPIVGGTMTGDLYISSSKPSLSLQASAATATFNRSNLVNETGIFKLQTLTSGSVLVSTDYQQDKTATGASVHRFRIANVDKLVLNGTELTTGADAGLTLGTAALRWGQIYSSVAAISTSDRNYKTDILNIDEQEKKIALKLKTLFKKFKYKDSVEEKGLDNARIHIGLIAQEVRDTFIEFGLDPNKYGMFCEDTWYEYQVEEISKYEVDEVVYEKVDVVTRISKEPVEGSVMKTRLALRYEELLCFIIGSI